jgi:hypothetical protein
MPILAPADYPQIRAALDLTLTAKQLPDATIALPIFLGNAEAEVVVRYPEAASATDEALQHVKNAICYLCAALLAPVVSGLLLQRERIDQWEGQRQVVDWTTRADDLRAAAEQELAALADTDPEPEPEVARPTYFTLAKARKR